MNRFSIIKLMNIAFVLLGMICLTTTYTLLAGDIGKSLTNPSGEVKPNQLAESIHPDQRQSTIPEISWSMAGANPQRTSWVPQGVDPTAAERFGVEWYRPIEAYIGQHVQLIAARNKLYVATARGLYALDAATGDEVWRFDTELPLGHSPTVDGDYIYVGGLDKRVYALNADSGAPIWIFAGATGGFTTNPLVVAGRVLLGSRDGYFYTLDRQSGLLVWQYPPARQPPLGPIFYSAAYQAGQVFFVANDNYAYALDVNNGALLWRSDKLPGDGYQAWWPVVYDRYVVFSAAPAYAEGANPGAISVGEIVDKADPYYAQMHQFQFSFDQIKSIQRDDVFHQGEGNDAKLGPEFTAGGPGDNTGSDWPWPPGSQVIKAEKATEYLENDGQTLTNRPTNKPWRRGLVVLNVADGAEATFDSDQDGRPEYGPFLFAGTKSGNRYPPLVIPTQTRTGATRDLLYAQNLSHRQGGWGISRAMLMGWQVGTPYLSPVGESFAIDEPFANSAGGNMLYVNLCCDRVGNWHNLATGQTGSTLFGYGNTLESIKLPWSEIQDWQHAQAPGYDQMWFEASMYDYYPRLYGAYGTANGIYHNHGLQNPIIPYGGRLFVHRSNAIIAFGPNPTPLRQMRQDETPAQYEQNIRQEYPGVARPLLTVAPPDLALGPNLHLRTVQERLDDEIAKLLAQGHLRPGYYNGTIGHAEYANYFENPGDTLYTLVMAYPYVAPALQPALEKYIKQEYHRYFENDLIARTGYWIDNPVAYNLDDLNGFGQLQPREWMPIPPEVSADMQTHQADRLPGLGPWDWDYYPQQNIYAIWQFADTFFRNDAVKVNEIYAQVLARFDPSPPLINDLKLRPDLHNAYIAGYVGLLRLQELAGQTQTDGALRNTVTRELEHLLTLRISEFNKDHPWVGDLACCGAIYRRSFNIARNFINLRPPLGDYLHTHALAKLQTAVDEYDWVAPYWVATRYEAAFGEFASDNLYTHAALFQAKAQILQEPSEQLLKYLDAPAFASGDLFYLQNLVTILQRAGDGFLLYVDPAFRSLAPGGSTTITIQVEPTGAFADVVTLQVSNAPTGLTIDLDRSTLSLPGEATLTVRDQGGGVLARHTQAQIVQITASGGGVEKTATLYLSVGEQPIVEQPFPFYLPLVTQP